MAAKVFEVGDILPAGIIAIYGEVEEEESVVITFNNNYIQLDNISGYSLNTDFTYSNKSDNFMIIDLSLVSQSDREVVGVQDYFGFIEWEEVISGYSITFEENGGSTVTDLSEQTTLPNPLPTPTKANHVFAGWFYDNLFTQKANAGDELTTNVTLYAKWFTPTTWCEDIADAIREKDGTTTPIKHLDFPDKIKNIQGAKPEETKTVTPDFSSGNVVVTPTSGKVLSQVTVVKDSDLTPENIVKDVNIFGVVGTAETGGDEIISLMATREYYAIKTGTQSSALRWKCSTELFNKPIFIDANGNLYTPAQVNVYFNGTYKTRADTTLYTFGTYSTTMTGTITFKTVSGGIIVSLINLNYFEDLWGTGVSFYFNAGISWSVSGGSTGVSLQTRWASICFVQKTWLNNFSDITDGYFSDSAVIDSTIIANGGAIGGFSIHLEDPD